MPQKKLQFRAGVNREGTTLSNEGGWFDSEKIRFRSGYPEKVGGWAALSYATFQGVCRSLWNWITLAGSNLVGIGTNLKFYIEYGSVYYDITPIKKITGNTGSAGPPVITASTITLTASGTVLTVSDSAASGVQINDFVTIAGAGTIGGVSVNGEYQVKSLISGTSYTVTLTTGTSGSNSAATITISYQIATGGAYYSIGTGWGSGPWSPYLTATLTNPFTASSTGVSVLTVTQTAHGLTTGNYVSFASIASNPCGINRTVLQKAFQITVTGVNTYTISTAIGSLTYTTTSTAASGGAVTVYYPDVTNIASYARGWGTPYSAGIGSQLRLWNQINFGENLLFSPRGGALYVWTPGSAATPSVTTAGSLVSGLDVPAYLNQVMVSDSTRIVIALGCSDYGTYPQAQDPMLIRWSAQESYTNWTPTSANTAGSTRLSHGSYIMAGQQTRQEILIWTDAALYSMQFLGLPYVFGFNLLSDNISMMSPNAMATANGVTYWMGTDKFYCYSGRVETLPCAVKSYVFENINRDQAFQVYAGSNEGFNEIWWFYCSASSSTIDRYVIFNYLDRVWYYGTMGRTAWLDSPLRQYPLASTTGNLMVYHENGVDDGTTNPPSPITSYVTTSDFDIDDGDRYSFIWQVIPDVTFNGSNSAAPTATFSLAPRQNTGAPYGTAPAPAVTSTQSYVAQSQYKVQQFKQIVYTRVRGRQMAFTIGSDALGTQWQLGVPRINIRQDGRR